MPRIDVTESTVLSSLGSATDEARLNVFQQAFWVAEAHGANASHVIDVRVDGMLVCRLPYMLERGKFSILKGGGHFWTHLNGIALSARLDEPTTRQVVRQAIGRLSRSASWCFQSYHGAPHADLIRDEFQRAGFRASRRLTFSQRPDQLGIFLPDPADTLGLYAKASGKMAKGTPPPPPLTDAERRTRRNVKRARESIREAAAKLDVVTLTPNQFTTFYGLNLLAQGDQTHSPLSVAEALLERAVARGQGRVTAAVTRSTGSTPPTIVAAVACVWDDERSYLWMMGVRKDNDAKDDPPGAMKLAIAHAIRDAHARGLIFDTDGVCDTAELYRHRLHLPNEEYHDIFTRDAPLVFLARRAQSHVATMVVDAGFRARLFARKQRALIRHAVTALRT